jgi:uncharacterized membrane protein
VIRGRDVSRLEGFSDAVFGFALTLLVVSLEVPEDFADLRQILVGFPAFAVTFTLICWIWFEHYLLFRRYDLEDGFTVVLNCILLFIVVFYAYPLKFMATRLISGSLLGMAPRISEGLSVNDARLLMTVFGGGFMALFGTFMLLHWNALRQRNRLNLDQLTAYDARASMGRHAISAGFGLASLTMALLAPIDYLAFAGLLFFLMGPAHGTYGYLNGRARERLEKRLCQPSGTQTPATSSAAASAD